MADCDTCEMAAMAMGKKRLVAHLKSTVASSASNASIDSYRPLVGGFAPLPVEDCIT